MQISLRDIFLQQPHGPRNVPHPIFGLNDPFKQRVPDIDVLEPLGHAASATIQHWGFFDRISLSTVIPELGVVIVATPKGRAAILSLCQSEAVELAKEARNSNEPIYYFRLEWLLPFKSQEERGERPLESFLVGLAAGPIQGMLRPPVEGVARRWRIMLTFRDHTVLNYEISRESGKESGRVEVEELLF
jgi:hypothetical protein